MALRRGLGRRPGCGWRTVTSGVRFVRRRRSTGERGAPGPLPRPHGASPWFRAVIGTVPRQNPSKRSAPGTTRTCDQRLRRGAVSSENVEKHPDRDGYRGCSLVGRGEGPSSAVSVRRGARVGARGAHGERERRTREHRVNRNASSSPREDWRRFRSSRRPSPVLHGGHASRFIPDRAASALTDRGVARPHCATTFRYSSHAPSLSLVCSRARPRSSSAWK